MTENKSDEKLKFTWQQVTWGLAIIGAIFLSWGDLRNRVMKLEFTIAEVYTKAEIDRMNERDKVEHLELERDIRKIKKRLRMED